MTAIYGVLIFQKQPYMVLKQNWRNYSIEIYAEFCLYNFVSRHVWAGEKTEISRSVALDKIRTKVL
jgi:hypothetical protein